MADKTLIRACKRWDKLTTALYAKHGSDLYRKGDYDPLNCTIVGKKAELVVGSSPGHRTHVDLEEGRVNYYDYDKPVNNLMKEFLEEAGLRCEVGEDGVACKGLNQKKVDEAFTAAAMATSMDLRISSGETQEHQRTFWWPLVKKAARESK